MATKPNAASTSLPHARVVVVSRGGCATTSLVKVLCSNDPSCIVQELHHGEPLTIRASSSGIAYWDFSPDARTIGLPRLFTHGADLLLMVADDRQGDAEHAIGEWKEAYGNVAKGLVVLMRESGTSKQTRVDESRLPTGWKLATLAASDAGSLARLRTTIGRMIPRASKAKATPTALAKVRSEIEKKGLLDVAETCDVLKIPHASIDEIIRGLINDGTLWHPPASEHDKSLHEHYLAGAARLSRAVELVFCHLGASRGGGLCDRSTAEYAVQRQIPFKGEGNRKVIAMLEQAGLAFAVGKETLLLPLLVHRVEPDHGIDTIGEPNALIEFERHRDRSMTLLQAELLDAKDKNGVWSTAGVASCWQSGVIARFGQQGRAVVRIAPKDGTSWAITIHAEKKLGGKLDGLLELVNRSLTGQVVTNSVVGGNRQQPERKGGENGIRKLLDEMKQSGIRTDRFTKSAESRQSRAQLFLAECELLLAAPDSEAKGWKKKIKDWLPQQKESNPDRNKILPKLAKLLESGLPVLDTVGTYLDRLSAHNADSPEDSRIPVDAAGSPD